MAASYPGTKKTYTDEIDKEDLAAAAVPNSLQDEVQAIEEELGTDVAGNQVDLKTRLAISMADDGAMKNDTSFPGSPSAGDFFWRSDLEIGFIWNGTTWKSFSGALEKGTSFPTGSDLYDGFAFYRTDEDTLYIYNGSSFIGQVSATLETFLVDGTFTAPGGITTVYLTMVAGGGGGGGNVSKGGGGGGGETVYSRPFTVIPGNDYTVQRGDGGAGSSTNGTDGQNSVFDVGGSPLTVEGGKRAVGNTGGAGGGTDLDGVGAVGGGSVDGSQIGGTAADGTGALGGGGGGTPFGKAPDGTNSTGASGTANTGCGGAGSGSGSAGGTGGSGIVIVEW